MEYIVLLIMCLTCFGFLLKQTFHGARAIMAMAVVMMFFTAMSWRYAIEQSRAMIAAWLADGQLMLNMAVLMSIDVAFTMFFCIMHVNIATSAHVSRRSRMTFTFLKYFPGLLVFPVMFATLVTLIFMMPGVDFQWVAWMLGAAVAVVIPVAAFGLRSLLPEYEIRLELLFLVHVLTGLMGIVATVNGRTAVAGVDSTNLRSLAGVIALVAAGMATGWLIYGIRSRKLSEKIGGVKGHK